MACESPVVISTECHFPEVAEAAAGVVVQLNAQAVAAGIQTVLPIPLRHANGSRGPGSGHQSIHMAQSGPADDRQLPTGFDRSNGIGRDILQSRANGLTRRRGDQFVIDGEDGSDHAFDVALVIDIHPAARVLTRRIVPSPQMIRCEIS